MSYKTLLNKRGVIWTFTGSLTGEDIIESSTGVYGLENFDQMKYQILNILDIDKIDVDDNIMEEVTVYDQAAALTNPYILVAVVATDKQAERLVQIYGETTGSTPWKTAMFSTMEEAYRWINSIYPNSI